MTRQKDWENLEVVHIKQQVQRAFERAFVSANDDCEYAGLQAAKFKFEEQTGARSEGQKLVELLRHIQ